jgi:acyl carrier protein
MKDFVNVQNEVTQLIMQTADKPLSGITALLDEGYLDSLLTMQLISNLEASFNIVIPTEELIDMMSNCYRKERFAVFGPIKNMF